jgi:hypothetical protein
MDLRGGDKRGVLLRFGFTGRQIYIKDLDKAGSSPRSKVMLHFVLPGPPPSISPGSEFLCPSRRRGSSTTPSVCPLRQEIVCWVNGNRARGSGGLFLRLFNLQKRRTEDPAPIVQLPSYAPLRPWHHDDRRRLSKTVHLTERMRLRFEGTFTNLLNHPNFAPPPTKCNVVVLWHRAKRSDRGEQRKPHRSAQPTV